ncbi:MAG TPA: hypothetical protein VHW09_24735 [Bryobacteraceae bacterium]|jgi:hypothetical protein|nr:hypothetical protein [Bryobacteraceae bacterium]
MTPLTPRDRRRLQQARENGYLNAACRDSRAVVKAYGLWCWRLKLPMLWFERLSPYSRFANLRLDMLTTPNMLTVVGQQALAALADGQITAHDAVWQRIPMALAPKVAHGALRAVLQVEHYRLNRTPTAKIDARRKQTLKLVPRKRATA